MSLNYKIDHNIYDYPKDTDFIYEQISVEIAKDLPMTSQNIDLVTEENAHFIQLVNYFFNSLVDFLPQQVVILVFDNKATLLKSFQRGNCDTIFDSVNIVKGSLWSAIYTENPVGISLKRKKATVCEYVFDQEKWTMATVPINAQNPIGLISMAIPSKYYSLTLLKLFKFLCEFTYVCMANTINLSDTQKYFEQMFGSLAHEVKNTLTTARGFVQLLAKDEVNPDKIAYANFILNELDRAHGILKNSIFYSSSREQRVNLCKISDILHEVLGNLHAVILNSNIVLDLDIDPDLPHITGDKTQFRQVFLNIIQNAIEAMPNGGTLTIRCYLNNLEIHTVIKDTGPGIPANLKNKVFQPFFSTKHAGTGLGLSVSKQIIEQYKGQIFVMTGKNKGTSFTIVLPI